MLLNKDKQMYTCIVWGIGDEYEKIVNQLHFERIKGNLEVTALIAREKDIVGKTFDGICVISKKEIFEYKFDYLIITSSLFYNDIYKEAIEMGIDEERIINGGALSIPLFDFARYIRLIQNRITILSDDCWAGYIYHSLSMKFYTPLINTLWSKESYIKFIQDPSYYFSQPLMKERESDIRGNLCPVGSLGDCEKKVYINFVHSYCFSDAEDLWNKRVKRINMSNLFVKIGIDAFDEKRDEYLKIFNNIKEKKICFYSGETDIDSVIYLKRFEKFVRSGNRMDTIKYVDYCRNMKWLYKSVDILRLLDCGMDYLRE